MENSEEGKDGTGLGDLTENCISIILSFTAAKNVCSLAAVSPCWRSAADSNLVWERMINEHFGQNISQAISSIAFPSMKELYISLVRDHATKSIWLDESTGKIGCMLSARDLVISWGDNSSYWEWVRRDDSRFPEVARLRQVWWFHVWQRFTCNILSPDTLYKVSFIVRLGENRERHRSPVVFFFDGIDGIREESARFLDDLDRSVENEGQGYITTPLLVDENGWTEFVVGEFILEEEDAGEGPQEIEFSMRNTDTSFAKTGIWVEGVKIVPKY